MDQATTVNAFETFNWKDPNFISEYTQALNDVSLYFRCDNQTRLEQLVGTMLVIGTLNRPLLDQWAVSAHKGICLEHSSNFLNTLGRQSQVNLSDYALRYNCNFESENNVDKLKYA